MKTTVLSKYATVVLLTLLVFIGGWMTTTRGVGAASTWHVATAGSDSTGNGSEAQPFATIQHGIDVASHGDTVLVHPGVYRENINFNGKNITVGSLFVTTGNENYILQTVIDGNRNDHVVTFTGGEGATAKLSGFTITNGYAHGASAPDTQGGGVFCNYSSPTLIHLRVTGNEADGEGGGLYFAFCSSNIRDVAITSNLSGTGGGGIRYSYGNVNLENVVVSHNSASLAGSGMQFYHAEGTVKNALIADNSGGGQGGGLQFDGCSPTFTNVTIVGNRTTGHGGGLNVSYMSQPTLVNSIVWGNSPEQIYFDTNWGGEAITIEYSDIEGGEAGIVTNGQGPVHWGSGNLDTSPRFVEAGLGNYRLANSSSCIGASKVAGTPSTDLEGNPRPNPAGSKPDMGAYENPLGSPLKVYLPLVAKAAPSEWLVTRGADLRVPRAWHTATRLSDGRVLLVGGQQSDQDFTPEVELFDPATGQTSRAAPLHTPRNAHTATLLPDGRVLVVGGYNLPRQWLDDAEVYDPAADTWTVVPPRYSHATESTATLMKDGRVLVVGGNIGSGAATERVEFFNPQTNAWSEARPLSSVRSYHTAQLLDDGRVLMAGGWGPNNAPPTDGDAQLYDPRTDTWTTTGPMMTPRRGLGESLRLSDGRVLVVGGALVGDSVPPILASAEIYDPASNTWTAAADLSQARLFHVLELLPNGQVVAIGGSRDWASIWNKSSFVREIELYDLATNAWRIVGELSQPRAAATATLLPDGRVWLTGGRNDTTYFSDTWLIGLRTPAPPAPLLVRYDFEGDFLASGVIADRSGNGHDAQVSGAVAQATGISGGQGIAFTGNGYTQAAGNPAAGRTNVTFSLWFKTEHPEYNYKLASAAWWNGGPGSGWIMATHIPEFWSDNGQGLVLSGQPNNENGFAAGAWNHEVVTYDGSRIKEYTNGQLVNDWSTTGAAIGQGQPMVVGAWPPFTGYNFQGSMDEFAIYGRSLTQKEVQALYDQRR